MDNYINDFFKTKLTIKSFCKQNDLDTETFSDSGCTESEPVAEIH